MARTAGSAAGEIEFIGPPRRLIAVGALPGIGAGEIGLEGPLADFVPRARPALRQGRGGRLELRLRPDTPPGEHAGVLRSGKESWPAKARVQPVLRARVGPAEMSFRGSPGSTATVLTTLVNEGNVPVELPKFVPIGLFDDDGVETAFATTYRENGETIDAFLSTFTRKLREAHGGLMKLSLARGAGSHPPGAIVAIEVAADLPAALLKGHRYHGIWSTDFANIAVSVTARD